MNRKQVFDDDVLRHELAQMEVAKVLGFVCLCAERVAPLLELSPETRLDQITNIIEQLWANFVGGTPMLQSTHLEYLEEEFDRLLQMENTSYDFELSFVADAVETIIHALKYINSYNLTFAIQCGCCVYCAFDELSYYVSQFNLEEHPFNSANLPPTQVELLKQHRDLEVLKVSPVNAEMIWKLRAESQHIGRHFVFLVKNYILTQNVKWQECKSLYLQGSQVEGYIENVHPKGLVINLGNHVQGIAPRAECQFNLDNMSTLMHQNVLGIVTGYDEMKRWVVLRSVILSL